MNRYDRQSEIPVILIAEDDPDDRLLIERAFQESGLSGTFLFMKDGEELIDYLFGRKQFAANEPIKPDCILLDLNMPKMNGIEFLTIVKADMTLKKVPVVVLTTSNQQQDITECFKLGVAGYMVKSVDYDKFVETIRAVNLYWTISELPSNGE